MVDRKLESRGQFFVKRKKERHNERNDGNEFVCVQDESRRGAGVQDESRMTKKERYLQ